MPQQETIDVTMPDGTLVTGVPKGITQSELSRRFAQGRFPAQKAPTGLSADPYAGLTSQKLGEVSQGIPPEQGFGKTLLQQTTGATSLRDLVTNAKTGIGYTAQHPIDAFNLLAQGWMKGMTAPGEQITAREKAGEQVPTSEKVAGTLEGAANVVGMGTPIRQIGENLGLGRFKQAAGVAVPLAVQAALMRAKGPITTEAGETGALPATKGLLNPTGNQGIIESVASSSIGGSKLRAARIAEQEAGTSALKSIIAKQADLTRVPKNPAEAATSAGLELRNSAKPLYEEVGTAMREPTAAAPAGKRLAQFAETELKNASFQRVLANNPELSKAVVDDLSKMRTPQAHGAGMEGQPSLFDIYSSGRSNLRALARTKSLSPNEGRIVSEAVSHLDEAMDEALEKTRPDLQPKYRAAIALTRQGYALQDFSDALGGAISGSPESIQAGLRGAKVIPQAIDADKLVDSLNEMAHIPSPGKASRLEQAFPKGVDAQTVRQIADYLLRSQKVGKASMASKFGALGMLRGAGAAELGHPTVGSMALAPGVWMVARALGNRKASSPLLNFFNASPGSVQEAAAAARISATLQSEAKQ